MKAILILEIMLCMVVPGQTSIAAEAPPIRAIYQRHEDFPDRIMGLSFEEVKTGKIIVYHSKDEGAEEEGSLFYEPVLSPSGAWIFLPFGRFEGFIFFPARRWREGLVTGTTGTRFYVLSPFGPAFVHQFVKWLGEDEVRVTVGSELSFSDIDINLRTRKAKVVKGMIQAEWLHFAEVRSHAGQTKKHGGQK